MGNRRKMKHTVCRTSKSHIYGQRIHKCFFCHNVSRTNIFLKHFHNLHPRMFCKTKPLGIDSRNGSISLKTHAQNFRQTVHGVGCIHTGTGTAGRTKLIDLIFCHCTGRIGTYSFKHTGKTSFFTADTASQHRTAANKYRRNIQTSRRHQKSRNIFITVRHHNKGIKLMSCSHTFGRICNQIPCYERIFHTNMAHSNTVTYSNSREDDWCAASHGNAHFYSINNFVNIHMSRYDFIIRTHNTNQGS